MSIKYRTGDDKIPHFITFSTVRWIDIFTRENYREIVINSLKYCIVNKGLRLNAWIIMSNHLHLIMNAEANTIGNILRDFKKFTSRQLTKAIEENGHESRKDWILYLLANSGKRNVHNKIFQLWQQDNHPIELRTPGMIKQKLEYLHFNPVRSGIVSEPQHFKYSSAIDYLTTSKGLLDIEHLF